MTNRYERLSNSELIEILQLRSLPKTGKRADYIARLLEYDRNLAHLESNRPSDLPKDVVPTYGPYLFYKGDTPGMHGTVTRIRTALANNHCDHELLDINAGWAYYMFWEKESKGRSLPALVKGGRIIGVSFNLYTLTGISDILC